MGCGEIPNRSADKEIGFAASLLPPCLYPTAFFVRQPARECLYFSLAAVHRHPEGRAFCGPKDFHGRGFSRQQRKSVPAARLRSTLRRQHLLTSRSAIERQADGCGSCIRAVHEPCAPDQSVCRRIGDETSPRARIERYLGCRASAWLSNPSK